MAHQSLYRKYRPATFDAVVGQQHIERTIRNAIAEGKVAHAYLFTGPRGTGKTTTARLLAKALLCERAPAQEPDGTCPQCIDIAEGNHPDVREIDAASNTGVDAVREEIIGRVQYASTRGGYKIYIIDEVHMLSIAAFNALLKTLEEPPEHVVFVMCTTHPQKVPDTIHSRCQRFDFRRISVEEVADRLRFIAESEGFKVDRGAFPLIAKHADGGMRDAITALEQLAAFTGGEITVDDVEGLLGEVDSAQLFAVAGFVARGDVAGCFRWVAEMVETGADLAELVRELMAHTRDLYVMATVGDGAGIIERGADEMALLKAQAGEFTGPERLAHMLDLFAEASAEMRWSSDPRLSLEVCLTRMARPQGEITPAALAARIEALESGSAIPVAAPVTGKRPASAPAPAPAPRQTQTQPPAATPETEPAPAAPEAVTRSVPHTGELDRGTAKRNWQAVLVEVRKLTPARAQMFSMVEIDVDEDGRTLVVEFPGDQAFSLHLAEEPDMRELLRKALSAVYGAAPPFRYQLGRGPVRPAAQPAPPVAEPIRVDVAPDAEEAPEPASGDRYESATGLTEPAASRSVPVEAGDLQSVLLDQLGAQIVAEHPAATDGEDE